MQEIPQPIANEIYDILVELGGAYEHARDQFLAAAAHGITEYRFGGHLGFGGKFWTTKGGWTVDCYPEDETAGRLATIDDINHRLATLLEARKGVL